MASASVATALPLTSHTQNKLKNPSTKSLFKPLLVTQPKRITQSKTKVEIHSSLKENVVTGLTAASLTASMVIPDMAYAAGSDLTPSLQNFLLSIFAGGAVLTAIFGAVIGVSNFDPVKRA